MQNHEHKSQELPQATHLQQYCINKKFSVLSGVSRMPTHADAHGAIYHCGLKTGQNHHTDLVRLAWLLSARSSVTMSQNWPIMGHFAARIDLWCYTSGALGNYRSQMWKCWNVAAAHSQALTAYL